MSEIVTKTPFFIVNVLREPIGYHRNLVPAHTQMIVDF